MKKKPFQKLTAYFETKKWLHLAERSGVTWPFISICSRSLCFCNNYTMENDSYMIAEEGAILSEFSRLN